MSIKKWVAGEEITADGLNAIRNIIAGSYNAGETIAGATLPVPVYQNTTDNEFYACDANVTTKLNFVGFAITNSTDGNPMDIQFNGIVKGFTALAEGERYYVQDAVGTIGTSPGTATVLAGQAISETELLILNEEKPVFKNGLDTKDVGSVAGIQYIAHGLGKIPKKIKIMAMRSATNAVHISNTVYNGINQSSISLSEPFTYSNVFRIFPDASATTNYQTGVITFDATNIIITWTKNGTPGAAEYQLLWEAEV